MTAIAHARLTDGSAPYPSRGTAPAADDQMFYKGTLVSRNADDEAIVPVDNDGFNVSGVCQASLDGRDGKPDENADVEHVFGVFGFTVTGDAPKFGDVLYVVDNQTVSLDPDTGRGVAGICVEYRERNVGNQAFVWVGPLAPFIAVVQAAIADFEARIAVLESPP